jgi:hypothetical protein
VRTPFAELVVQELSVSLGPHTARTALKTFAHRAVGKKPEDLTEQDAAPLVEALRPMLRTLIGADQTEVVLQHILDAAG